MFLFNFSRPKRAKALAYLVIFSLVLSNFSIVIDTPIASAADTDGPICGNGIYEPGNGEECDDGPANVDGQLPTYDAGGLGDRTYCSTSCLMYFVPGEYCGDTYVNGPEECDDGNTNDGDGCSSSCVTENTPACDSTISGYKYLYDGDETSIGLEGWDISLTKVFGDQSTVTVTTDGNGYYEFIDICYEGSSDEYRLQEYVKAGWNAVSPSSEFYADVFIDESDTHLSRDFYNEQIDVPTGELKMCKQNDEDGDADPKDVDPMLKNWDFTVDGQVTYNDADDGTSDGCATIDLPYGTYNIDEVLQSGWSRTGTDGNGTEQADGSVDIDINSPGTYIIYFMNQEEPEPELATIIAHKIVCDNESYLPDWGSAQGSPVIDKDTANNFLATGNNAEHCEFAKWNFEWAPPGTPNPGDNNENVGAPWTLFGEQTQIKINDDWNYVWVREVPDTDYIPFTGKSDSDTFSAEMYCYVDSYHYDNYERIDNIEAGDTYYCVAFNVLEEGYCGDKIKNQDWEQCDGGEVCTDQCQWEEQNECSDLTLARVNVHEYSNEGDGDLTDDIYLGSDSNVLPNGTWFAVYWNGAPYNIDADILGYEDVEGLAVQRLADSVRIAMHASQGSEDIEQVDATLEFYNANATDYSSDPADNNKLESGGAYPDSVNVHDGLADFYLWANTGDDGFYVDWGIIEDCTDPSYSPYCGDGEVNQKWEQCDPNRELKGTTRERRDCTEQCQWEDQNSCSDLTLAKVNIDDVQNWGNGDMTNDLFLGSASYKIPNDVWFPVYWQGNYFTDPDIASYEDVEGFAVQRLEDSVRTVMYGTGTGDDKEHVSGHVEFYNATLEGQRSDDSNDNPGNNRLEKGFDNNGVGSYNAGDDEVWEDGEQSKFWLTTTVADDGYYSDWAIVEDCTEGIRVCKYDTEKNPLSGWEMTLYGENLVTNGGFEYPTVENHGGKWERFDSSEVDWDIDWVDDYSDEPILELQTALLWAPYEGNQYAELDSDHPVKISQDIGTVVGADYEFGFAFSARQGRNLADNRMQVDFGAISEIVEADGSGNLDNDWNYYRYDHTATTVSTNLLFTDISTDTSYGDFLDDVVVRQTDSDVTGDDGCVLFKDIPYGSYEVHETMQEGWTQVEPVEPDYYTVEFNEENYNPTVSFVNEQDEVETYDVRGYKWNDENGNSIRDCESLVTAAFVSDGPPPPPECEVLLSGWTINLYEGDGTSPIMTMDTSNEDNKHFGWYWFENLPAGEYRICEELQEGWTQTYPKDCHFITLPSVFAPEYAYNFGNQLLPYCGDGEIDEGEDCDDGPNGSEFCSSECTIIEDTPEEYCGDNIQNGDEECDDGPNGSDICTSQCIVIEEDSSGPGGGGPIFLNSGSGFFDPGTPSTPQQVLGTKIVDEEEGEPTPEVLGFKTLPETGANSDIFYFSLFLGLMSVLYAAFVQIKNAEEN